MVPAVDFEGFPESLNLSFPPENSDRDLRESSCDESSSKDFSSTELKDES